MLKSQIKAGTVYVPYGRSYRKDSPWLEHWSRYLKVSVTTRVSTTAFWALVVKLSIE